MEGPSLPSAFGPPRPCIPISSSGCPLNKQTAIWSPQPSGRLIRRLRRRPPATQVAPSTVGPGPSGSVGGGGRMRERAAARPRPYSRLGRVSRGPGQSGRWAPWAGKGKGTWRREICVRACSREPPERISAASATDSFLPTAISTSAGEGPRGGLGNVARETPAEPFDPYTAACEGEAGTRRTHWTS